MVRRIALERLTGPRAMDVLRDLAFDHDIEIPIDWVDRDTKRILETLGFIKPLGAGGLAHIENSMPAGLAAILSPLFEGVRTTLPLLLGAADEETVKRIATNHGLDPSNHHVPLALSLSEILSEIEVIEDFAESFSEMEVIGPAMMALELGGLCYWQEIFGYDLDGEAESDKKVVAFMRPAERHAERDIAQTLLDYGICFRVERGEQYPMLVVPEELWVPLWELGRTWLLEWTASTWGLANEHGVRKATSFEADAHSMLKVLVCEADAARLPPEPAAVGDEEIERWTGFGWGDADAWRESHRLGWELGVWHDESGRALFNPAAASLLDAPRPAFIRSVLLEWVTGYVGAWADQRLSQAVGLDEAWRQEVIGRLLARGDFAPTWLHFSGIAPDQTGAGCLRAVSSEDPDDLLIFEMGLANGLMWTEKLMWLDLVSMLEGERWYTMAQLVELMQMAASVSIFGQLLHVLENPNAGYYIPVQRASFLVDPFHEDALHSWLSDVMTHLFEPLGIARRDGEQVWLDTPNFRVPTPPGLTDEGREIFMRDIFAEPELDFRVPSLAGPSLRPVPSSESDDEVEVTMPIQALRDLVAGHSLVSFDGRRLRID